MIKRLLNYFFIILVLFLTLGINISAADDADVSVGTSYTVPSAQALLNASLYRGHGQDRQNIGIYMPAGSSFKIRSTSGKRFRLDLLNDDSATEVVANDAVTVASEWITIEAEYDSVPFIVIPNGTEDFTYEIKDKTNVLDLPVFKKGENESEFFANWNTDNQKFAVIEDDHVIFLVPSIDKNSIINNPGGQYNFSSLDDMLNWYDTVIEHYDNYVGLSKNASNTYDEKIPMRFFIKSNKSGIGGSAFKPYHYIYETSASLGGFLRKSWGALHEIGHAYQHGYTGNTEEPNINISEVGNNIFAYFEEQLFLSPGDGGFLWTDHNQEDMIEEIERFNNFNELIEQTGVDSQGKPKYNYHFYERLFIFTNLLDKIGMQNAMKKVSSEYRRIKNENSDIVNSDLFGIYFTEGTGYNVIPYLNFMKVFPSNSAEDTVYSRRDPIVYPLAYVVNENVARTIATNKNLRGIYSVVENNDIKNYINNNGIKRNVKFNISTNDNHNLLNKTIYIKNSSNEIVKEQRISGNEVLVQDIPVGMYYVDISNGTINNLNYLLVAQDSSVLTSNINYTSDGIDEDEGNGQSESGNSSTGNNEQNNQGSSSNVSTNDDLVININYDYDPKNYDDQGQLVEVPNTGVTTNTLLIVAFIFIAVGSAIILYKKDIFIKNK